ncbi:phosphatidate cytidylyltransferase [Eubacterium ruminantium]|uniref:phosphatidate cytidylyltransferase n=1 Tax=Eubacterium ruminantium TaxID=42322 RepID=UPI002479CE86|nr:phosphatidate cytidylyltransferase [Eubacterium ruminantium]
MFVTRLISGIVLVILAIGTLYFGGAVTCIATLLISLVGVFELMRVYKIEKKAPAVAAYLGTIGYYILLFVDKTEFIIPGFIGYLLVVLAIYVLAYPKFRDSEIMATFTAFFYVSVMLSYVYRLRIMEHGGYLVILIFICSWGNDTLAYCTGILIGKHKMSPKLSPKKSIEGLIGGILGAGILGAVFGIIYSNHVKAVDNVWLWFGLIGAIGAIPAVIGDLAASAIKRNNDIKDYGKLIPGHGGILDRFDSMIFTAPIIYYLVNYLI